MQSSELYLNIEESNGMDIGHDEIQMFELFAAACDRLNEYARTLDASRRFFDVRTGADIRNYQSGWRLEKWIEADIQKGFHNSLATPV